MKEATGELNMTVVTVVAIAAVGAFFYAVIWPGIKSSLAMNNCKNMCPDGLVDSYSSKENACVCTNGDEIKLSEGE